KTLILWADEVRELGIRTNAEAPADAAIAKNFGAEGIGLCRTEHMFFDPERIIAMREMIVAETEEARRKAVMKLLPYQKEDFYGILKEMQGFPVTIRLLDPPLHEFITLNDQQIEELSKEFGMTADRLKARIDSLHELNPMLGHRGCRLGIAYPEITEMQARAIFEAAAALTSENIKVFPEVMVPLTSLVAEFENQRDLIEQVARKVMEETNVSFDYLIGTMIETPRACLVAQQIGETAEFFSFGTNDLTQTTFGFSRDDIGGFLPYYLESGILPADPFETLDQSGVGQLVEMGVKKGRSVKPKLKIGICGEHGGDPDSIDFCHRKGLDYVSCSPFRVPIARLAAAHAAIKHGPIKK
ncbi:MAG: putative PEP-binding protein, partial [Desulfobacterales bacterium]